MEYGILVVEDGNELYQILGSVHSMAEAVELAAGYEKVAEPENEDAQVPPTEYVIMRRNSNGFYTRREVLPAGFIATVQANEVLVNWSRG